jgi:hypothetical protein
MSQIDAIQGRIEALQDELRTIPPHRFNAQKIADRKRGIELCEQQLARIERMHANFLVYRAELVARHHDFAARNGGR